MDVQLFLVALLLTSGMLAVGCALDVDLLVERLRRPAALAVVLAVNVLVVPLVALLLIAAVDLPAAVELGIVLAAAAPGGGTGALLSLHARGDVATAAVLQVVLGVAALVVTPTWVAAHGADGVDVGPLVVALVVFQLVPVAAGVLLRGRAPARAEVVHAWARRVADVTLLVLVVGLLVLEGDQLGRIGPAGLAVMAVLVLLTLGTVALPVGDPAVRRAAAMTTAVRNLSLALLAASYADDAVLTTLSVLAYGLVMYVLAAAAVPAVRRV